MKFQKSATTLVAIMALAAANTAFATVLCLPTNDIGNGLVEMPITSTSGLTADATFNPTGAIVSVDVTNCTTGKTTCTVFAQGTPAGGIQSVVFTFVDADVPQGHDCPVNRFDGLPVELSKFSVE